MNVKYEPHWDLARPIKADKCKKQTLIHNVLECDLQEILSMKALGHGRLKKGRKAYKPTPPNETTQTSTKQPT